MLNDDHYLESAARQHVDRLLAEAQAERLRPDRPERVERRDQPVYTPRRAQWFALLAGRLVGRPAHSL